MTARWFRYQLNFKRPAGTSRGVMHYRNTWFIILEKDGKTGIGEAAMLSGLSADDHPGFEKSLDQLISLINRNEPIDKSWLNNLPSLRYGLETARISLETKTPWLPYPSEFTNGRRNIPINGLIWMGEPAFMKSQIKEKISQGFRCIKMKIGAIGFNEELSLLKMIRREFSGKELELRVDANGAFSPDKALEKLNRLAELNIHSIEQPIRAGQWEEMARLCENSPVPVALDEELIGINTPAEKQRLIETIRPAWLILKPALVGGFDAAEEWIGMAEKSGTGWWVTSALESNLGLNALAQWTAALDNPLPQGLGTGSLFTNNFRFPLFVRSGELCYNPSETPQWPPFEL